MTVYLYLYLQTTKQQKSAPENKKINALQKYYSQYDCVLDYRASHTLISYQLFFLSKVIKKERARDWLSVEKKAHNICCVYK